MPGPNGQDRSETRATPGGYPQDEARLYTEAILDAIRQPVVLLNRDLRVEIANPAFYRTFEVDPGETEGYPIYQLSDGQWNIPSLRKLLDDILILNHAVEDVEVEHEFERIGWRVMVLNARRMESAGRPDKILLAIEDITEHERTRWELDRRKNLAEKIFDASRDALLILGWDLRVKTANATFYSTFRVNPAETEGRVFGSSATASGTSRSCANS